MRLTLAALSISLVSCGLAQAGNEQLALSSQLQYQFARVIEGATDGIIADVYNNAPSGSDAGHYKLTAQYAPPHATSYTDFSGSFTGTKAADGGSSFATKSFRLDTTGFDGGDVAVKVTLQDTDTGRSVTQGGQFTVLDHATPGLLLQGQLVALSSKTVTTFDTDEGPGAGESSGSSSAGMQGRSPTAELDLDSITHTGSPEITSTLSPFRDLPSDSDPAEAQPFTFNITAPPGHYSTTFFWHYSDEDDLPGADAPGSQLAFFNVTIDVAEHSAHWVVTTDVPEPSSLALFASGCVVVLVVRRL
jgi:hypothetical protein